MSESTRWEKRYAEEAEEIAAALADHAVHVWPHSWPASTHPDGSETGNPAPKEWDPEPPTKEEQ